LEKHGDVPSEVWKAAWLLAIFAMYFAWDLLDIRITNNTIRESSTDALTKWLRRAKLGGSISLCS